MTLLKYLRFTEVIKEYAGVAMASIAKKNISIFENITSIALNDYFYCIS